MQQFVSQPVTYQQNSALGIQSLMPQAQSVVPQMGAQTLNLQSVAIPQAQSVVPSVVPQMQSVVPSVVPQVQSVVPSVVPSSSNSKCCTKCCSRYGCSSSSYSICPTHWK